MDAAAPEAGLPLRKTAADAPVRAPAAHGKSICPDRESRGIEGALPLSPPRLPGIGYAPEKPGKRPGPGAAAAGAFIELPAIAAGEDLR